MKKLHPMTKINIYQALTQKPQHRRKLYAVHYYTIILLLTTHFSEVQ